MNECHVFRNVIKQIYGTVLFSLRTENVNVLNTYEGMSGAGRACPAGLPPGTGGAVPKIPIV